MDKKENYKNRDDVLAILKDSSPNGLNLPTIAVRLKIDIDTVVTLCEQLYDDEYLDMFSTKGEPMGRVFKIKSKGKSKLLNGGFIADYEIELDKRTQARIDQTLDRESKKWNIRMNKSKVFVLILTSLYTVIDIVFYNLKGSGILSVIFDFFK